MVDTAGRMLGLATSYRGWDYGLGIPLETVERVTAGPDQPRPDQARATSA